MTVKSPLKRSITLTAAALSVAAMTLSGCGAAPTASNSSSASASGSTNANAKDFTGCIVSDEGGFDDESFNQASYDGLQKAKADLGIETKQAESKAATDYGPNLNSMVRGGCNLTVTVGFNLGDATKAAAKANPDAHFAIVDYNDPEFTDNVKPIVYNTHEAAFLAGYLAAGMTKTGKVATYGGMQIPTVTIFMDGFVDGVAYYNEQKGKSVKALGWDKAKKTGTFTGDFSNKEKGKTNTINFVNEGADIVMPVAGPVGAGTIDAVKELTKSGKDTSVIWVDLDGYESLSSGKEFILSSVVKEMGKSVEDVLKADVEGNFKSEAYVGNLENEGVSLAPFHDFDSKVPAELKTELETLKADIISGKVKVESASANK